MPVAKLQGPEAPVSQTKALGSTGSPTASLIRQLQLEYGVHRSEYVRNVRLCRGAPTAMLTNALTLLLTSPRRKANKDQDAGADRHHQLRPLASFERTERMSEEAKKSGGSWRPGLRL